MTRYLLLPATEADKDRFRELHELCYRDVVERQFGEWDASVQGEFFEAKWNPSDFTRIVVEGETVGGLVLEHGLDHAFLSEIQVAPEFQGQGLGRAILRDIQADAADSGVPVRLQVLRKSRAIELYVRLGFTVVGETDTHAHLEWNGGTGGA